MRKKMKRHKIQVRILGEGVKEVERVLVAEQIGNFNPLFCTYNGKKYLVHSTQGDISDPFRRDESYLKTLYIEVEGGKKCIN
jgi:hypothetical protein